MTGLELVALAGSVMALLVGASLEVAARSASRFDFHRWVQRSIGSRPDAAAERAQVEAVFTSIRLFRQIALVVVVVVVAALGPRLVGGAVGAGLTLSIGLALLAYLLVDKLFAFALVATLGPMRVLGLGRPVIFLLRWVLGRPAAMLNGFMRDSRAREEPVDETPEDGDLDAFLDMAGEEGLVSANDEALLRGVAEFSEVLVDHVMTPRVNIVSIAESATLEDLRRLVAEHKLSRIPVVRDNIDQVVGTVNIRELVEVLDSPGAADSVAKIARPALFVPESKRVSELLREFQRRREHLAIVVDEYGGTAGLVTIEDLLEEIVGEIQDEHEDLEQTVVRIADGAVVADGKAEIEELEEILDVEIGDDEFETVGGMAFVHLGYVPKAGEAFERDGLRVEVLEADERRVHRVRISPIPTAPE